MSLGHVMEPESFFIQKIGGEAGNDTTGIHPRHSSCTQSGEPGRFDSFPLNFTFRVALPTGGEGLE